MGPSPAMAKAVPLEPFLPSGNNGHKGGFAPSLDKAAGDARSPLFTQQNDQNWAGRPAGVSLNTLKNWERGRTKPAKQFWPGIRSLLAN